MAIDLKQFRTFIAVAEELSFSKAAKRLNLTQPPVSLQIRQLEDELCVRLFERGGRTKMKLTGAGKVFLDGAREALLAASRATEYVALLSEGKTGHLRIGHSDDFQTGLLPKTLARFHELYPGVRLSLQQRLSIKVIQNVLEGELDLGFICLPIPRLDTSLVLQELPSSPIVAIVPSSHALADEDEIFLRELGDEPFYLYPTNYSSGFSSHVGGLFAKAGITPKIAGMSDTLEITTNIVSNGFGVSMATLSATGGMGKGISILRLKDANAELKMGLVYPAASKDLPLINNLLELLA